MYKPYISYLSGFSTACQMYFKLNACAYTVLYRIFVTTTNRQLFIVRNYFCASSGPGLLAFFSICCYRLSMFFFVYFLDFRFTRNTLMFFCGGGAGEGRISPLVFLPVLQWIWRIRQMQRLRQMQWIRIIQGKQWIRRIGLMLTIKTNKTNAMNTNVMNTTNAMNMTNMNDKYTTNAKIPTNGTTKTNTNNWG